MVLRKISIDKSVRYIPTAEIIKEKEIKTKTTKTESLSRKQDENISQNNKKFLKKVTAGGFAILK